MSLRSCHCCQEPGRVFVWIVSAMTVTKVVEGCVYIRRRYYGILPHVGGEFELSANSPISLVLSSNATTLNHLIRLRGSQGIQIWKQRTHGQGATLKTILNLDHTQRKGHQSMRFSGSSLIFVLFHGFHLVVE